MQIAQHRCNVVEFPCVGSQISSGILNRLQFPQYTVACTQLTSSYYRSKICTARSDGLSLPAIFPDLVCLHLYIVWFTRPGSTFHFYFTVIFYNCLYGLQLFLLCLRISLHQVFLFLGRFYSKSAHSFSSIFLISPFRLQATSF